MYVEGSEEGVHHEEIFELTSKGMMELDGGIWPSDTKKGEGGKSRTTKAGVANL